jgi:hypothetical protein
VARVAKQARHNMKSWHGREYENYESVQNILWFARLLERLKVLRGEVYKATNTNYSGTHGREEDTVHWVTYFENES